MSNIYLDLGACEGNSVLDYLRDHPDCDKVYAFEPVEYDEWSAIPKTEFIQKAVWVEDGEIAFTLADYHKESNTLMPGCVHYTQGRAILVPCIDFSAWVRDNIDLSDHVTMKMDIEGAEYDILDKMIAEGTIAYIDDLRVEFHDWIMPEEYAQRRVEILSECPVPITIWG